MSPTKRLKCHSEPKRSGGEESKILRRCAPQDNSIIELVAGSNKVVVGRCPGKHFLCCHLLPFLTILVQLNPLPDRHNPRWPDSCREVYVGPVRPGADGCADANDAGRHQVQLATHYLLVNTFAALAVLLLESAAALLSKQH